MEAWKDIEGFEGYYQVSNMGRIKSLERKAWNGKGYRLWPELILKQSIANTGYPTVTLRKDGKSHQRNVHRLVAQAFLPNPLHLPEVNHKFGNKLDNRASELEWVSSSQNIKHAHDTGLNSGTRKMVLQYDENWMIVRGYDSLSEVGKAGYGISQVSKCCLGKIDSYKGFHWQYFNL